jgi:hypothetical protein
MAVSISIPKKLYMKAEKFGIDVESMLLDLLIRELNLNPKEEAQVHLELAQKNLNEGEKLAERDPVQASEKLYKAAEECIKALSMHLGLEDIMREVKSRGRWVMTDLERAARTLSKRIGEEFYIGWDRANYLHIWGFHEAKLESEAVKSRIPYIKRMVESLKNTISP